MKNINQLISSIIIVLLFSTSCSKDKDTPEPTPTPTINFETNLIGTWNEAQHIIDGDDFSSSGETISFFSNGSYTSVGFTYPWHCEPGAKNDDSGVWSYDSNNNILTLNSTKAQVHWDAMSSQWISHGNSEQSMNVVSFTANEFKVQFSDVNCSQNVVLTFHR
ncbi:MAG: hypothetical protein COA31_006955 [Flavobacteriales bacterium]|nr:hypothetical protein [Flavobacteriales bacterium]